MSNIAEGVEQPTDRAFAKYLYDAKASNAEVVTRLLIARKGRLVTDAEHAARDQMADEIARMTG